MTENVILLWSGGLDSTAILLELFSNPEKYPKVLVVGVGLKNANNYKEDKEARQKIATILGLEKPGRINYIEREIDISVVSGTQSMVWALVSSMAVSQSDKPIFLYGYIRHDDFWHNRHNFEEAVKHLCQINGCRAVSFDYPLEWKTKKEIISLYINYPEVFRNISWGGDTATVKAKEKEELECLFDMLQNAKAIGQASMKDVEVIKKVEELLATPISDPNPTHDETGTK